MRVDLRNDTEKCPPTCFSISGALKTITYHDCPREPFGMRHFIVFYCKNYGDPQKCKRWEEVDDEHFERTRLQP